MLDPNITKCTDSCACAEIPSSDLLARLVGNKKYLQVDGTSQAGLTVANTAKHSLRRAMSCWRSSTAMGQDQCSCIPRTASSE